MTQRSVDIWNYVVVNSRQQGLSLRLRTLQLQLGATALGTLQGYKAAANKLMKFLTRQCWRLSTLTANQLAQFAAYSFDVDDNKAETVKTAVTNIRGFLRYFDIVVADEFDEVSLTLEGICREEVRPTKQAIPILGTHLAILEQFFTNHSVPSQFAHHARAALNVHQLQLMKLFTIGQNALLRVSELVKLKWSDLTMTQAGCRISISRSKANQKGPPEAVVISNHHGNHTNASIWINLYITKCPKTDQNWIFPNLSKLKLCISETICTSDWFRSD